MPSSNPGVDLDAYFRRIDYRGARAPTLAVLRGIQESHVRSIPFENLDSLAGEAVAIDLPSIQRKLIGRRRGGYCYEHNMLLWAVLERLGFHVSALAARVRWQVPPEVVTALTHMALRVHLDGTSYLVDAGFGGLSLTGPLNLAVVGAQSTPLEECRVSESSGIYLLEVKLGDIWSALYRFDLMEHPARDYDVFNWYTCTSPQSLFVNTLMAASIDGRRRHALLNNRYTVRETGCSPDVRLLAGADEIRHVLEEKIGVSVPESAALRAKLGTLMAR